MKLREWRKKRGLTQEQLGELVNVSHMTVLRWENDQREPRSSDITRLCAALNITEAELLNGESTTEWRVEAVFSKEENWDMNESVDMSAGGANMFLAQIGSEKIHFKLIGSPKDEEELDSLWAKLKPQIMSMVKLRDGLNEGLSAI